MTGRRTAREGLVVVAALAALWGLPAPAWAQTSDPIPINVTATAGGGPAQSIFASAGDRQVLTTGVAIGWFVGDAPAAGDKPGGFEIVVEFVPTIVVFQSERVWGAGVLPIGFRWTSRRQRIAPYIEWASGIVSLQAAVPEGTATRNFVTQLGFGVRLPTDGALDVLVGYRLHHISNGNTVDSNPGVNSHVVQVGVGWRPRR